MKDFQKLLLARADTRLMVFEATNPKVAKDRTDRMIAHIRAYARTESGDRYMFACLDNPNAEGDGPFHFDCREYIRHASVTSPR